MSQIKIYLAGKISKGDWRHEVVPRLRESGPYYGGFDLPIQTWTWPVTDGSQSSGFVDPLQMDYVGPFFISDDHGCSHGDATHGCVVRCFDAGHVVPHSRVVDLCLEAIKKTDIFFAWFDDPDATTAYGTLAELGYAKALGKTIIVAFPIDPRRLAWPERPIQTVQTNKIETADPWNIQPWETYDISDEVDVDDEFGPWAWERRNELWFVVAMADHVIVESTPVAAVKKVADLYVTPDFDSPLEEMFWQAHKADPRPELDELVAQHPVTVEGRNYRLDFALVEKKIAFELDGYTYHSSREAWAKDRRRDLALAKAGWRVHRFDGDMVRDDITSVLNTAAGLASR